MIYHIFQARINRPGRKLGHMDPIATARYGLMAASQRFEASATQIVQGGATDAGDLAEGIIGLTQAKTAFKANATVIRFAEDMWDSLLDIQSGEKR